MKLTRLDIINQMKVFLEYHKLDPSEVWVCAGSAMALESPTLREYTGDIDVACQPDTYDILALSRMQHTAELHLEYSDYPILGFTGGIDVHREVNVPTITQVSDIHYMTMNEVLWFKKGLNRPKDQNDIKNLAAWVKKHG